MVLGCNDQEVIEGCRRGEPEAFRMLFEAHRDKVYSIGLRYSGDAAVAMDIAQDVFLKLFACIKDFRGQSRFESWLYRMVANRCLDHQRQRRRLMPLVEDLLDGIRRRPESVLDDLLRAELERDVQNVVGSLPPEQRIVVVLRYTEGLSYDEIAEALNCSRGTVGSRLNRAHAVLERRLSHLRVERGGNRA